MILIVKRKQAASVSFPSSSRSKNFHFRSYLPANNNFN